MNPWMIPLTLPSAAPLLLIVLAALLAMILAWRNARHRRMLLVLLQLPCAALLLAALLLADDAPPDALIVLTRGAPPDAITDPASRSAVVALPGAVPQQDVTRVPDLATALRQRPAVTRVHVIGEGLQSHDRDALGARAVSFAPSPPDTNTAAITALTLPEGVAAGAWWTVQGRVAHGEGRVIELRDPADATVASSTLDADGAFALSGLARAAGLALFSLRLLDGETVLQSLPVGIDARQAATPLRALLLAAAPSPELKFLRRWATDAGITLTSRIALSPGFSQQRGGTRIDAATLADIDLLIVDERSWSQLGAQQAVLREAIANGMGLMIRITGPVPERVARDWAALGVVASIDGDVPRAVKIEHPGIEGDDLRALHAWRRALSGQESVALVLDVDGTALAARQIFGRGRIGVWGLADSHRLVTRGAREAYATLWSSAVAEVARVSAESAPVLQGVAVMGERAVVCAADEHLSTHQWQVDVMDPALATTSVRLLADPANPRCAAFWPRTEGWHVLRAETAQSHADTAAAAPPPQYVHVYSRDDTDSIRTHDARAQTAARVTHNDIPQVDAPSRNLLRATLLIVWMLLTAGLWWMERRVRQQADVREAA